MIKTITMLVIMALSTSNSYGLELLRSVYTKHLTYSGYNIESRYIGYKGSVVRKSRYQKYQENNNFLGLILDSGYGVATMTSSYNTSAKALFKMYKFGHYISNYGFKIQPTITLGIIHGYPKDPENNDFSDIFVPLINPAIRVEKNFTSVNIGIYSLAVVTVVLGVKL
jgi:hypothetical protein